MVLQVFPCELSRGEVAQKFEVVGAASVDPNSIYKDAPFVNALRKLAFDKPSLVSRRVVRNGVEVTCSLLVGRVKSPLPGLAHLATGRVVGVAV